MQKVLILFFICLGFQAHAKTKIVKQDSIKLVNLVNPFIGTGGHGHTFPGPTMPFGACQVGPDTRLEGWDGCSGYHYDDSVIYGFSHTHLSGTGCSDYGDILLMPVTKEMQLDKYQYASKFSHATEKAHAGYYEVFLDDPKVNVELTSTLHGGFHRYKYQMGSDMYVVLDLKHRDEVLDSKMEQVDDYTIRGYRFSKAWAKNQKVFYEIKFSQKIEHITYEPSKKGTETTAIQLDKSLHCLIKFENPLKYQSSTLPKLLAKVSISGVDEEGAHKNLVAEMPEDNWNFESYKQKAEQEWEMELSKIKIEQIDNKDAKNSLIIFYTALYHCMIHPSIYNDVDGRYRGRDDKIHNTEGKFNYYTVFSLWDTYRALHPLLTILDKKRTNDFINTFIKQYEQCGRLPIWELSSNETNCMIGYHVVSVIWDAYNKGIRDYDANKAYEAMKSIATHFTDYETLKHTLNPSQEVHTPNPSQEGKIYAKTNTPNQVYTNTSPLERGERGVLTMKQNARERCADADALESYNRFGYVRSDDSHESVSKTLEYAYDDWCIAQMANALGKKEDFEYYTNRSYNWMNVYDPTTGFMRARKNGCLYEPFSPYTVDNNYTEANAWQYSFYVPHDVFSLIHLQGGIKNFEQKLDDLFNASTKTEGRDQADITGLIGQYAHGNEPSHQIAFNYAYTNSIHKKEGIIKFISDSFYHNKPNGLIGNEDCGQMSAWYILSSIGIYPFCPGDNIYYISKPMFNEITINNYFKIISKKMGIKGNKSFYTYKNFPYITYDELNDKKEKTFANNVAGSHIHFPYNSKVSFFPTSPFMLSGKQIFKDSLQLEFVTSTKNTIEGRANNVFYESNERLFISNNDSPFKQLRSNKLVIKHNSRLNFYLQKSVGLIDQRYIQEKKITFDFPDNISPIQTATFTKIPSDRQIILKNQYNKSYHAGGADGLMDGIYGKLNWRAGDWQGYQGQDVEVIMAFEKPKEIKNISANFLEDQNSWIFYPKEVSFYVSNDSINWTLVETIPTNKSDHEEKTTISKFQCKSSQLPKSKFVKMIAKNFGPMPQWHEGRGEQTFIFIDELIVE